MGTIKLKMGYCPACGNTEPKPITGGYCQYHYWQLKKKPIERKPQKIKPVSKNRQEALKRYNRLRDKYFEAHAVCEFPGCDSKDITLHHKKGRIGANLTDKRFFCSLCWPHHQYVETHPEEAYKLGLSIRRTDN